MKKLFTLIVAICATTLAWADDSGSCGSNVTYTYVGSTGTLTISGTGAMKDYNTNPNDRPWYGYSPAIKKVIIEDGVTSIGSRAFYGCTGLTSVTIPNSVTSVGERVFSYCTGLTSVTIGNGVTSIGDYAFSGCTGLTSMTVEATNPPICFNNYGAGLDMPNYTTPLYVPAASVDAYKAADEWKKFTNIQAIPATGVNEAAAEKSEVKKIIDRNGIIYIEKDGTRYFLNGGKVE